MQPSFLSRRSTIAHALLLALVVGCGGGTGHTATSGPSKTSSKSKDAGADNGIKITPTDDTESTTPGSDGTDISLEEYKWEDYQTTTVEKVEAYACVPRAFPEKKNCQGEKFTTASADKVNWAEALQKALWFFAIQKSGPGVTCTDTQWRGDADLGDMHIKLDPDDPNGVDMSKEFIEAHRATLDPDGDGTVDVSGGFHDAGDYIKFGLTNGFAAHAIAWSMYEFPDSFRKTGLEPEALRLLRWFADYFMRSTFVENGDVIAFCHQVGDGTDHTCGWMPPEVRRTDFCPRKAYFATTEKPAADVTASAAAALALIGKIYHDRNADEAFAEQCLLHAKALYRFAAKNPAAKFSTGDGLYTSEYAWDDLAWASIWLATATGEWSYIDDAVGSVTNWTTEGSKGWISHFPGIAIFEPNTSGGGFSESWTYCWNSLRSAIYVQMATLLTKLTEGRNPNRPEAILAKRFRTIAREDSMAWVNHDRSPGGFAMKVADLWGSGRYNSAAQLVALVYAKHFPDSPSGESGADATTLREWALSQSKYLLGDNPLGTSYVMGMTDKYMLQPHHAAGHASLTGLPDDPPENRHILWGALVSGPSDANDGHDNKRSNFAANEVTIDYNAVLVGALAGNFDALGLSQCPIDNFPPIEPPIDEFYTKAKINSDNTCSTQVTFSLINESIHPPRYDTNLKVRYFFDVSELYEAGVSPATVSASIVYDSGASAGFPTAISPPQQCTENGNMYFIEFDYEGSMFWGELAKLTAPRTTQFEVGFPSTSSCTWDTSNDWSLRKLNTTEQQKTPYLTVYSKDKLIFGEEPPCFPIRKIIVPPPPPPPLR